MQARLKHSHDSHAVESSLHGAVQKRSFAQNIQLSNCWRAKHASRHTITLNSFRVIFVAPKRVLHELLHVPNDFLFFLLVFFKVVHGQRCLLLCRVYLQAVRVSSASVS